MHPRTHPRFKVGDSVGYQIRFDSSRSQSTRVLFLTEGLLLRQMQADPMLSDYSCIVLDEVHERHLTMDLLLAILRALLRVRSDLHLVLMSATANVQMFAQYFTAPICTVPGRCYPVQVQYHPPPDEQRLEPKPITRVAGVVAPPQRRRRVEFNCGPYLKLLSYLEQKYPWDERGDVLVFLPGINEICALQAALAERAQQSSSSRWIVLPLHSTVSADEQDKVFDLAPDGSRKIILATNIAETSITIDGIRFVVDSGRAKDMVYDEITRTHSLKECTICKASAEQRKGRAGRTGPGVCFRIYSERVYEEMPEFPVPEIHKAPLESLALSIKNMKLGDPRRFPFVDPPPLHRMDAAMLRLRDMGCLRGSGEDLTALGSVLAALPVDVGVGKMLVLGTLFDLADECLTLAAALATQSPLLRVEEGSSCLQMRRELLSDDGDPFTIMNMYARPLNQKSMQFIMPLSLCCSFLPTCTTSGLRSKPRGVKARRSGASAMA
jgi:ATP-dependent RNA helicase DHX34